MAIKRFFKTSSFSVFKQDKRVRSATDAVHRIITWVTRQVTVHVTTPY